MLFTNAARNVSRLVALLDDLDEITKLENNGIKLNEKEFIIQDLIKTHGQSIHV